MGLDFGIQRKRKGEAYKTLQWEDCCWWRNCHEVKEIFHETIEFNDDYEYPITLGAIQILIQKLSDELQTYNFNDMEDIDGYSIEKLLTAIADLSAILNEAIYQYEQGIEYDYKVIDSF